MPANRKTRRKQNRHQRAGAPSTAVPSQYAAVVDALVLVQKLRDAGQPAKAVDLCRQTLSIEPANPQIHLALALALEDVGRLDDAATAYRQCIALAPAAETAHARLAQCLAALNDLPECIESCKEALRLAPHMLGAHQLAGNVYERMARFREAAAHFKAIASSSGRFADFERLGRALYRANDIDGARAAIKSAMKDGAPRAPGLVLLARLEASRNRLGEAKSNLKAALHVDPHEGHAHLHLATDLVNGIDIDEQISLTESALASGALTPNRFDSSIPMQFALGNLYERKGQYDRAFEHFRQANDAIVAEQPDDSERFTAKVSDALRSYGAQGAAERAKHGSSSEQPVFVFGLPRSGTTLVEQILCSHSQVHGLGELEALDWMPSYLNDATPDRIGRAAKSYLACYPAKAQRAVRVVDKSISTYINAGLALSLFPNAWLINCTRHPLAIALSLYKTYFGPKSVPFANSFKRIAQRIKTYERLMAYWHDQFPGRILDVGYEDLIRANEKTAKSLVAHIGLDWEPACLDFHKTENIVHTASLVQVRQPIYASAIDRWRRYETHLEPLRQEIALIVENYERALERN